MFSRSEIADGPFHHVPGTLNNSRSIFFFLGLGTSSASNPFTRIGIVLFAGLGALLAWTAAPRLCLLATQGALPVSIQPLEQRFPSVAGQRTSTRAVELSNERVGGQVITGFRTSRSENASPTLVPAERMTSQSDELSVFFPGTYEGPFAAMLGSQRVVLKAVGAKPARGVSREGRIEYAEAYQSVDSLQVPGGSKSEEFLLLRSAAAPVAFEYEVIEANDVSDLEVVDGAVRFMPPASELSGLSHSVGMRRLELARPWVIDAAGKRSTSAVRWEVVQSDRGEVTGAKLRLRVDPAGLTYPLLVDPGFTGAGSMTTPRYQHTATLLPSGKVLVAGGSTASGTTSTAELFDPATGTFTATSNMTLARQGHTATLLPSGKVLIAGGTSSGVATNRAEVFDPATGTFTGLFPNNLTTGRAYHTATLLPSGKVLLAGGFTTSAAITNTAELFDPASATFISLSPNTMTSARYFHTATLLPSGQVLLAGGFTLFNTGITNTAELFNPASGTFTSLAPSNMSVARVYHTATLLPSGKVLIAGGDTTSGSGITNTAELYDPGSGNFTSLSPNTMTSARARHTATLLPSGKVLLAAGVTNAAGAITNTAELFDPTAGTFTSLSPSTMYTARDHTATLLPGGKVLIAGGYDGVASTSTAELFDPAAIASFTSATQSNLNQARRGGTATVLPTGRVLIAGGISAGNTATNSAELFDPTSGTFTSLAPNTMTSARARHTATLLPSGKVLIAGGTDANGVNTNTAELFDPAQGTFASLLPNNTMASARASHTATLLPDGKVLLAGGDVNGSNTNTAELFDPSSGTFTALSPNNTMTAARAYHTATLIAGPGGGPHVLLAGGNTGNSTTNTAELFDPATGTFTATPNMTLPRGSHTATLLPNGHVLLAGGDVNGSNTNTAELFNSISGTFIALSPNNTMSSARAYHTATLLPGGQVLIAGGSTGNLPTSTADLFEPATGTFTPFSANNTMTAARYLHTATLLTSGKVLLAGGGDANGGSTNTAELFDLGLGFSDARRPALSAATDPLLQPSSLVLSGTGFRGDSEGSGSSFNSSATNYPVAQLTRIDNEHTVFPLSHSATNWSDTTFSSETLGALFIGHYRVTIFTNGIPSYQKIIVIEPEGLLRITSITKLSNGHILLQGFGVPDRLNTIQKSPDLSPNSFGFLASVMANTNGALQYEDADAGNLLRRFYRLTFP